MLKKGLQNHLYPENTAVPVWGLLSDLCVRNRSPCTQTVPGVPGRWPLRVSTPGPGSQHPSRFTDEKADLQKTKQLKPHSEDAARPGLRGGQPAAGSAPEPTAVLPAPPCRRHLAALSGPRPHTGGPSGQVPPLTGRRPRDVALLWGARGCTSVSILTRERLSVSSGFVSRRERGDARSGQKPPETTVFLVPPPGPLVTRRPQGLWAALLHWPADTARRGLLWATHPTPGLPGAKASVTCRHSPALGSAGASPSSESSCSCMAGLSPRSICDMRSGLEIA